MTQTCAPADQTVSGWHWVERDSSRFPAEWNAEVGNKNGPGWWLIAGDGYWPELAHERGYRYMCPCPTPEQIAEREAESAAWAEAARGCATDLAAIGAILGAEDPLKATEERERLVRALACGFSDWWEKSYTDSFERAGLISTKLTSDDENWPRWELTDLGRAAIELAKEPQS